MKKTAILVWLILLSILFIFPARAADVTEEQAQIIGADKLTDALDSDEKAALNGRTASDAGDLSSGVTEILSDASEDADGYVRSAAKTMGIILTAAVVCMLVRTLDFENSADAVNAAGALAITAACTGSLHSMLQLGGNTVERIQEFTNLLLPTMAAATAVSGGAGASSALYVASVFFCDVLMTLINNFLLPFVYVYAAIACADAAIGNQTLSRLTDFLKWGVSTALKLILAVFTGYLTITGVVSGTADAAAVRAAKLALSTAVPVVGSILSDASETLLVSAGLLRTSVGLFGMLAVLAICAAPFFQIGILYLALKLTAALVGTLDGKLSGLVDRLGSAMGLLLAMTGSCALMLLICCVCSMKAVIS